MREETEARHLMIFVLDGWLWKKKDIYINAGDKQADYPQPDRSDSISRWWHVLVGGQLD